MDEQPLPRCGAFRTPDGCCWRVWAPRAHRVDLVLLAGGQRRQVGMTAEGDGYFRHVEPHVDDGQRYAFRLDNGPDRPDPASLWQPDGPHQPSAVVFPDRFRWAADHWPTPQRDNLVLYELHVGTFTPEGTFDAVIPRLDALRDLGVTALEVMPVAQFPGNRNWGYDGVHLTAPQNSYGGPHGLQRLVDACHARGMALFLDVVLNHQGPEGNYLHEFGPYFTDRYRTPWGPAFNYDGPDSDPVRQYVLDAVRLWVEDYRIDGLRLDAVQTIFDSRPRHLLREIKQTADAAAARHGRTAFLIAESLQNDVRMVKPPEQGGHGLDAEWHDDFHEAVHAYLTGERHARYVDFGPAADLAKLFNQTFLLDGRYSKFHGRRWGAPVDGVPGDRFVACVQNHDQVGNRARGERLTALVPPAARRLAACLLLLSPHVPMLFMGEEYGEDRPFQFFCSFANHRLIENVRQGRRRDYGFQGEVPDPQAEQTFAASKLSWAWPDGTDRSGLRRLYADLLTARRQWPALQDFVRRAARLLPDADHGPVLEVVRGDAPAGTAIRAYFNLRPEPFALPDGLAGGNRVFTSEAAGYKGGRRDDAPAHVLLPYECAVFS